MVQVSLNEEGINSLILDINTYTTKIKKVLYDIESTMDETKYLLDFETGELLRKKFKDFKEAIPVIQSNLLTYKKDMFSVKSRFRNQDVVLSNILSQSGKSIANKKY